MSTGMNIPNRVPMLPGHVYTDPYVITPILLPINLS